MKIQLLNNTQIDKVKWNALNNATNTIAAVYNSSAYLDALSPNWEALIINDYDVALALPYKQKACLKLYSNPVFLQKLSIIGKPSQEHLQLLQKELERIKLFQLSLDYRYFNAFQCKQRNNYYIDLSLSYDILLKAYKSDAKVNVRKSKTFGLKVERLPDFRFTFESYKKTYGHLNGYTLSHFNALALFLEQQPNAYDCYAVYNAQQQIVYSVILLKDAHRYYYLMSGAQKEFQSLRPTYFFIDWFLQEHAQQTGKIFDFEGSDLPNVAFYFERYGAELEHYYQYYQNKLSFPLQKILDKKLNK